MRIRISWPTGHAEALLDTTPTTQGLAEALPFCSVAQTWGDEVYFEAPVSATLDANPKVVVPYGTVCFWVQGSCVAIPFGPTPVSEGSESRLVTAANVLGMIEGDPKVLASIRPGDAIEMACVDG